MPAVWMFERCEQFGGCSFPKLRRFRLLEIIRNDSINAATIVSTVEVEMFLDRFRNGPGMFDHLAVHVGEVKASIWSIGELNGTEPKVLRSNEFSLLLIGRASGDQGDAVGIEF